MAMPGVSLSGKGGDATSGINSQTTFGTVNLNSGPSMWIWIAVGVAAIAGLFFWFKRKG